MRPISFYLLILINIGCGFLDESPCFSREKSSLILIFEMFTSCFEFHGSYKRTHSNFLLFFSLFFSSCLLIFFLLFLFFCIFLTNLLLSPIAFSLFHCSFLSLLSSLSFFPSFYTSFLLFFFSRLDHRYIGVSLMYCRMVQFIIDFYTEI